MATLFDLINEAQRRNSALDQTVQYGVVIGYDSGLYSVNIANQTTLAESFADRRLLPGDRVVIIVGRGTPKIMGLQAKDAGSA